MGSEQKNIIGINFVTKILTISGLLFCLVGVFLILFVNVTVGVVLIAVGLCDLVASIFISRGFVKSG